MGMTKILALVGDGKNIHEVEFLVDSGATYTLLPEKIWKALKLRPMREVKFTLADGTTIKRKISEVRIEYQGLYGTTPVILGEAKDEALFGTLTLEMLGLVLNPFTRELEPMKMMLAKISSKKKIFVQKILGVFVVFLFSILCIGVSTIAEEMTLTTYYPAPYGVYEELTTTGNTYLATTSGNVGIGTTEPRGKLDSRGQNKLGGNCYTINPNFGAFITKPGTNWSLGGTEAGALWVGIDSPGEYGIYQYGPSSKNYFAGNVGIGITNPGANKLYVNGDTYVNGRFTTTSNVGIGGAPGQGANILTVYGKILTSQPQGEGGGHVFTFDIAEDIPAAEDVEPGDIVVIDSNIDQFVTKATKPYDISVAGIISESPAYHITMPDGKVALALAGRVRCKVTTENGHIKRGDLLTSSSLPGHAMKATKPGPIVGKALENLESGTGKIMVLVNLGWYGKTE